MDYLDDMKLKMIKNLNVISATFVVYTTKSVGFATILTWARTLYPINISNGLRYPLAGGRGQCSLYRKMLGRKTNSFWRHESHQSGARFVRRGVNR